MKNVFWICICSSILVGGLVTSQFVEAEFPFSLKFGSIGSGNNNLNSPTDISANSAGTRLYVADSSNDRIHLFNSDGTHYSVIGVTGTGNGQFNQPTAIKLDSAGNIFVVDSQNNRIQKLDSSGQYVLQFGSSSSSADEYLGTPRGLAIQASSGDIFVSDSDTDSISVFNSNGQFQYNFGTLGQNNGQFKDPSTLFIDDSEETLYVTDSGNNRIQVFKLTTSSCPSGTTTVVSGVCFVKKFGELGNSDSEFNSPTGLYVDSANDILYVADTDNNRIQVFKLTTSSCPSGTTTVVSGVCFVEKFGALGNNDAQFNSPTGLYVDSANDILYVADTDNDRIQAFDIPTVVAQNLPDPPTQVSATSISSQSILLTWKAPEVNSASKITGYKIESKSGSDEFTTLIGDTKSTATNYVQGGLSSSTTYVYRVYAINSQGISTSSSTASIKPQDTSAPVLIAVAISPHQIKLSWYPPSNTFNQSITGYTVQRQISSGVYDDIATVGSSSNTYTINDLTTDKEYSYVVKADFSLGSSPVSNISTATPKSDSTEPSQSTNPVTIPSAPRDLKVTVVSPTSVKLSWSTPSSTGNSQITGYKVEVKKGTAQYAILIADTKDTSTTYTDSALLTGVQYTYRVSAINSVGTGPSSNESSVTPTANILHVNSIGKLTVNAKNTLSFIATTTGSTGNLKFSLDKNPPDGAQITENGKFSWTPITSQAPGTYTFDIVAKDDVSEARTTVTVTVNTIQIRCNSNQELVNGVCVDKTVTCNSDQELVDGKCVDKVEPQKQIPAPFVDPNTDPQYYIDRYNNEPSYKDWFDRNYPEYSSIYEAVGVEPPKEVKIAPFVDPNTDPQYYIDRYNNEPSYKDWFDRNYPEYSSIYEAVGLSEPNNTKTTTGTCGEGTKLVNGICVLDDTEKKGGGCLIATATYGSELAPQVQQLRELRDNQLLQTASGSAFMTGFNQFYYSFSPTVADWERENPAFKELVKITLTPMLSSLSLLNNADMNSDSSVLAYGLSLIMLNVGMYFVAPAIIIHKARKFRL